MTERNKFEEPSGQWVRRNNKSLLNTEVCNGEARTDEITRTCALCVAANHTVYRANNKCEYAHTHCKCRYEPYDMDGAKVIFAREKIIYFLTDKSKKVLRTKWAFAMQMPTFFIAHFLW